MRCAKCGCQLDSDMEFCVECGTKVDRTKPEEGSVVSPVKIVSKSWRENLQTIQTAMEEMEQVIAQQNAEMQGMEQKYQELFKENGDLKAKLEGMQTALLQAQEEKEQLREQSVVDSDNEISLEEVLEKEMSVEEVLEKEMSVEEVPEVENAKEDEAETPYVQEETEVKTTFCAECGNRLEPDMLFCNQCGTKRNL